LAACLLGLPQVIKKHKADLQASKPFAEEAMVAAFYGNLQVKITSPPRSWQR
jgi:hypothetical protein